MTEKQENNTTGGGRRPGRRRRGPRRRGAQGAPRRSRNEHRAVVVMPTYNEAENIGRIIPRILSQHSRYDVLVVDDNSKDGTAEIVRGLQKRNGSRVHLLERSTKLGLGTAYVAGFDWALENGYGYAFEMDADFSHNPKALNDLFEKTKEYDLVIGSRYVSGVNVVNWPMKRLLLSYGANLYTRIITGLPVADATAGFKCYKRIVLETMDLSRIHSNGYSFQIETNFIAWKLGFKVGEVPIVFIDRRVGVSKMSKAIVHEAMWMVWKLKLRSIFLGTPRRTQIQKR